MSKNVVIELKSDGINQLLHCPEITQALMNAAQTVQSRAGEDFEWVAVDMPTRTIVRVASKNERGEQQNRDENTLLKSTFGGDEGD